MSVLDSDAVRAISASQRAKGLDLPDTSELVCQGERSSAVEDVFVANGLEFRPEEAMTGLFNASCTSARLV